MATYNLSKLALEEVEVVSVCYGCAFYDWDIQLQAGWLHICTNPAGCKPGDNVVSCEEFVKGGDGVRKQ